MKWMPSIAESPYMESDSLTRNKLREYIPVMILTNMSIFLLSTVDGIVAGNLVSPDALASINIFYPAMITITVISSIVDSGSATSLATSIGSNDVEKIRLTKSAVKLITILSVVFIAVVQVPIMKLVIGSYHLTPEVNEMVWGYAKGMMIALPLGVISSVGSYQLQILGKMRVLLVLSVTEGIANLVLDVFFVEVMHLGIVGIGFGTASANVIRCTATVVYLAVKTDVYNSAGVRAGWREIKNILSYGLPDAASMFMVAWQNYYIMKIILDAFGYEGGMIKGVCFFALNIANIITLGVQKSMRPLAGIYAGADDSSELRGLLRACMFVCVVLVSFVVIAVELLPELIYQLNGVKDIPEGGILALRLFALHFIFKGINDLFRPYFTNRKDAKVATGMTILGNLTLPIFAKLLYIVLPAPFLWLAYLMTELMTCILGQIRYVWWAKKDREAGDSEKKELHVTVKPEEAVEASQMVRKYAIENGAEERIVYRMALCMEEMVAYAVKSQERDDIQIQVRMQFRPGEGAFFMLDDGKCISLNENTETQELITDNYMLLKRVCKSVEYQYILNMNYTIFRF